MNIQSLKSLVDRSQTYDFMIPKTTDELDLSHGTILYLEAITVSFDGFKAIDDLNLYIDSGELRCIIGPNGAGKTTMMDVITGKTQPDEGSAWFGQRMNLLRMSEAEIATIATNPWECFVPAVPFIAAAPSTAVAQTIDGAASATLTTQYESITIVGDGTSWHLV